MPLLFWYFLYHSECPERCRKCNAIDICLESNCANYSYWDNTVKKCVGKKSNLMYCLTGMLLYKLCIQMINLFRTCTHRWLATTVLNLTCLSCGTYYFCVKYSWCQGQFNSPCGRNSFLSHLFLKMINYIFTRTSYKIGRNNLWKDLILLIAACTTGCIKCSSFSCITCGTGYFITWENMAICKGEMFLIYTIISFTVHLENFTYFLFSMVIK